MRAEPRCSPAYGPTARRFGRTGRYRFTRWTRTNDANKLGGLELYDHKSDPQENINIAKQPENAGLVKQLTAQLAAGWRAALPASKDTAENANANAASSELSVYGRIAR